MDDRLRKQTGARGEDAALEHLRAAGLKLVERNYRCRGGEIDLVMLEGATLVLVEVRWRSSMQFGGAAASVTWRKQQRLARAARSLLDRRPDLRRYPARFDVVAIDTAEGRVEINWIKGAFTT
ncbi:MAG TPA: YraN family protein [Steroidobacteraceae bacterium]|jgi:putative endonuclease